MPRNGLSKKFGSSIIKMMALNMYLGNITGLNMDESFRAELGDLLKVVDRLAVAST